MKKIFFLLTTFLSIYNSSAQLADISYGFKVGLNTSTSNIAIDLSELENTKLKTGILIGILTEFSLLEKFAVQPELLFSSQGYEVNYSSPFEGDGSSNTENVANTIINTKYDYINLPIMLKFSPLGNFNIQAGPQVGFLISAIQTTSIEIIKSGETTSETKDKEGLNRFDYGVNFGLGYELDLGLFVDLRYNLGLSSIDDLSDIEKSLLDESKTTNQVLQLAIGFKF